MRKIVCLMLAIVIMSSMTLEVFASEEHILSPSFAITEVAKEDGTTQRSFIKNVNDETEIWTRNDYHNTKELLYALGMEKDFIEKLSIETLDMYARAESYVGSVSYS